MEKGLLGQERKELFRKTKKTYMEIFNIHHTFKVPRKLISWTFRITKMENCNFFSSTSHNGDSHGGTLLAFNISFQFRQT